jgi:hypothetical protein
MIDGMKTYVTAVKSLPKLPPRKTQSVPALTESAIVLHRRMHDPCYPAARVRNENHQSLTNTILPQNEMRGKSEQKKVARQIHRATCSFDTPQWPATSSFDPIRW